MSNQTKISLILDNIRSVHNVGSIFRTADCFAISHIYIAGYTPYPKLDNDNRLPHISNKLDEQISKTALGAEKSIGFSVYENSTDAVIKAKDDGNIIAALEQSEDSIKLHEFNNSDPIAIVLGNEVDGVSNELLKECKFTLEIEQFGKKESLNVSNAASILMYSLRFNR